MKVFQIAILLVLLLNGCITKFIPESQGDQKFIVVEGLITDQPGPYTIKLSYTSAFNFRGESEPVTGFNIRIYDDEGKEYPCKERKPGSYVTDSSNFRGQIGRAYTLRMYSFNISDQGIYESLPMEMKPVPQIDSLYYQKETIENTEPGNGVREGCTVYLDTHDASNACKYYKWEYVETWEIRIPYSVTNHTCWVTANSDKITIKSTESLQKSEITRFPLCFISDQSDRLSFKYSALVNQYSLNENEYRYWERLQNVSQEVGGLYDMIPTSITSNVTYLNDPTRKVLGYFSVSAVTSKRIFIKDHFQGLKNYYSADACIADTVFDGAYIPNLNATVWVLIDHFIPPYKVITYSRGCADCTVRGSIQEPSFWRDGK